MRVLKADLIFLQQALQVYVNGLRTDPAVLALQPGSAGYNVSYDTIESCERLCLRIVAELQQIKMAEAAAAPKPA